MVLVLPNDGNYDDILGPGKFDRYLVDSLSVAVSSTIITLFTAGLCAYALAWFDFKSRI
ncbi:MAG: hypothetical protein V6Z86_01535 [Hyphomicrobiales bacterium]